MEHDVLIVGAGPSGAVAACELARRGLQGRLPRAGRLEPARRLHGRQATVGAGPPQAVAPQPQHPRQTQADYPIDDADSPRRAADVQRRRRQHASSTPRTGRALPVGLPGPDARRRRRRLAVHLRGPRAVLRPRSTHDIGVSGLAGDPAYRRRRTPSRCRRCRSARPACASARAHEQARLALVAGAATPSPRAPYATRPACQQVRRLRVGLPRRRQGQSPT